MVQNTQDKPRQELIGPPTPLRDINVTDNAKIVLEKRYVRKNPDGSHAETLHEMFWRVGSYIARAEFEHGGDAQAWAERFYNLLADMRFLPNSPTFTGADTPLGNLSACYVLPVEDDMGAHPDGIFQTLRNATLIQQTGGGNGFSFSRLRPKGSRVRSSNGFASGPIGFLKAYDEAFGIVNQGGVRRGANMGVLRVDHPDIREFITCKESEYAVTNFNISVALTDKFMQAVRDDTDFDLINPDTDEVWETVRARELFDMIIKYAHNNGEPGALFIDAANRGNPVPNIGTYEATNPCVTGDTRIYTDKGMVRAEDLFNDETDIQAVIDGRFGLEETTTPATRVFKTGVKSVYRLQTKEGYFIRATADHRIMTPRGWVELGDLQPGDRVHILNRKGGFGGQGSLEEGRVLGRLIGDGTIKSDAAVLSFFGEEKLELAPMFAEHVNELVAPQTSPTAYRSTYTVGVTAIDSRDEARVMSERLGRVAEEHGLTETKHQVPEAVFQGTEDMQRGFLQALFTADGSFQDGGSIRLASNHVNLLEGVQQILLNFGIASRIYQNRRPAGMRMLPDDQGGLKAYHCEAHHELAISKRNMNRFADEIGFLMDYKQDALNGYLARSKHGTYREHFTATVETITHEGKEAVYDLTEPLTHSFVGNSIVVHNCGEQWLLPYESCNLGSINLMLHVKDGAVDWDALQTTIEESARFLDNVVTMNRYVEAVPQLHEAAHRARRIGLGIMGLADMMMKLGIRYGSEQGQEFAGQVMEFIRYHAMMVSTEFAKERGPFPGIKGSIYDADDLKWQPPTPQFPYTRDWGRPDLDWTTIESRIRRYGIRNATQVTVAPTGTRATVAGCEGYGCEPVFALAYTRYVVDTENANHERIALQYTSPLFEDGLRAAGYSDDEILDISRRVDDEGTCQTLDDLPDNIRHTFVVSSDITPEEHVRMQAALQPFVDSSISKTINMPATATLDDVETAYMMSWELGCKGLTVYVTGSRSEVVLETKATQDKKNGEAIPEAHDEQLQTLFMFHEEKEPRPGELVGKTYRAVSPAGTAYITVNESNKYDHQPFEVFINTSKAGSEIAAISESMGRLISLILRMKSPISPRDRMREIVRQLNGIGAGRQMGFGPNRIASFPDAIAKTLESYLHQVEEQIAGANGHAAINGNGNGNGHAHTENALQMPLELKVDVESTNPIGDICPECGAATLIKKEGCVSCHSCGYAEC
jgi:ribonucleoside-diphosphate reductase alpha chain